MNDRGYWMVVYALPAEDGGGFVALAPDLHGCMADGDTVQAAISDLCAAIEEWIDECERLGRPVPKPGSMQARARKEHENLTKLAEVQKQLIKSQAELIAAQQTEMETLRLNFMTTVQGRCEHVCIRVDRGGYPSKRIAVLSR